MSFWRLVLVSLWGLVVLSTTVVALSAFLNIVGQLTAWLQPDPAEASAHIAYTGKCGPYGDCDTFQADRSNLASLQRGAATFQHYCLGCHSTEYARHGRVAADLKIPISIYESNLLPPSHRINDQIHSAMDPQDAQSWFGVAPPDLTMVTDARSADWVYTYLRSFYSDPDQTWGSNNRVFPQVGMPNVLESLQGRQYLGCATVPGTAANGGQKRDPISGAPVMVQKCDELMHQKGSGSMTTAEFDTLIYDLVNYLDYSATPEQPLRHKIGFYAIMFLIIFSVLSYMLYREYRKDYDAFK
ncbi:MAG: cytochrome c1 [Gammaproteobacteria bacterium]